MLAAYGLNANRFAPLVASGTVTGTLANGAKIIAVAGHDTQCASAAMPCAEEDAEHTTELVQSKCGSSVEVSHIHGGQPVYYYMLSVE